MKTASAIPLRRSLAVTALLLLAVLVMSLASSPPAQAQTATTLVSNSGEAVGISAATHLQAQSFTTGGNAAGYSVTSIEVRLPQH